MSDAGLVDLLHEAADRVLRALDPLDDWGLAGTRPGQYKSDLVADEAATGVLLAAGLGVLSEESGLHAADREIVVVVDPLDGSTNASRRLAWYATSFCAVDAEGPRASLVVDLPRGRRFQAVRGSGASLDGEPINPTGCADLADAVVGLSGFPPRPLGWKQYRAMGAMALDLCEVACGGLDGFVDCSPSAHGPWDYLGALLVCQEAGAVIGDAFDRELVVLEHEARRTPIAAATPELLTQLVAARA
jgi:myo-inositol-1(or 4)-monophosphatase